VTEDLAVINQGIALSDVEKYEILLQELISIRTERAFNCHQEVLSAKYEIAEAILNSPLYQGKNSPGSGHLLKRVSPVFLVEDRKDLDPGRSGQDRAGIELRPRSSQQTEGADSDWTT
jgi:hypothetical protein